MAPRFNKHSFIFKEGEQMPEHEEGWLFDVPRDPTLWHIDGYDSFEGESYKLASNIEDEEAVDLLARAARRAIEKSQPRAHAGSIQDRVYIIYPRAGR